MAALAFWIACVWLTVTALLLALFDLVSVRRTARREELKLRKHTPKAQQDRQSPRARTAVAGQIMTAKTHYWRTREEMERVEQQTLAPFAQKSGESRGRNYPETSHAYRTEFQRDRRASFIREHFGD